MNQNSNANDFSEIERFASGVLDPINIQQVPLNQESPKKGMDQINETQENKGVNLVNSDSGSFIEEDENSEIEEYQPNVDSKRDSRRSQRKSICAEVYGHHNPQAELKLKFVEKEEHVKKEIRDLLLNCFLFKNLDEEDMTAIVDAMEIRKLAPNTQIITQNDDGNELYVVGFGQLRCTKIDPDSSEDVFLKNYEAGEYFGELALLYNAPRAATIISLSNCLLYSLDRETFNYIIKESAMKNRAIYEDFLSQVEILQSLISYERSKLCDCLKIQIFEPDQRIINEGEIGNSFFLIIEGNAQALKINPSSGVEEPVFEYSEKMYFGELALLKDEPRAASIIAKVQ
jgi:cAMP-dependent protein kinase regulator